MNPVRTTMKELVSSTYFVKVNAFRDLDNILNVALATINHVHAIEGMDCVIKCPLVSSKFFINHTLN